jgi:hypothetical protein
MLSIIKGHLENLKLDIKFFDGENLLIKVKPN